MSLPEFQNRMALKAANSRGVISSGRYFRQSNSKCATKFLRKLEKSLAEFSSEFYDNPLFSLLWRLVNIGHHWVKVVPVDNASGNEHDIRGVRFQAILLILIEILVIIGGT